jgi:quercetin dioxygenase-like cupin family protein
MKTETTGAVVRTSDEGERRWFAGGGLHVWMAHSAETGHAFCAFVDHLVKGKMTPLHVHPDADDSMYVIEGEVLYHADGQERLIGAGGFATALRGTPHAFMVLSDTAKIFAFQTPGDGEAFYVDASDELGAGEMRDPGDVDIARMQETAARNEAAVRFLGPPPFAPSAAAE